MRGYEQAMRGRTTILISHRLRVASKADRVVVLEAGKIVEEGPPAELLRRHGAFQRLFAADRASPDGQSHRLGRPAPIFGGEAGSGSPAVPPPPEGSPVPPPLLAPVSG